MQELIAAREEIERLKVLVGEAASHERKSRGFTFTSIASHVDRSNLLQRRLLDQDKDEFGMRSSSESNFVNDVVVHEEKNSLIAALMGNHVSVFLFGLFLHKIQRKYVATFFSVETGAQSTISQFMETHNDAYKAGAIFKVSYNHWRSIHIGVAMRVRSELLHQRQGDEQGFSGGSETLRDSHEKLWGL
ncbi:hypothetical protein TrLO_g15519 [Triparma laevis f. longispina]|uniref:Uncharacterized protein n=1 Tax=Triparma laevis f. longispina TaxID=1714387 RepID=A0A9W7KTM2_9STRA|nr:hypothetical protein TrLO_g15519 [Triparma laevis f. longispina]